MIRNHLYQALRTALVFFIVSLTMACGKDRPDIIVDASSMDVFSSGIRVEAEPLGGQFSQDVLFSTTDKWLAIVSNSGEGWLSIQPSSGAAGKVMMTVKVLRNESETERKAEVKITCGTVNKAFTVVQEGKTPEPQAEPSIIDVTKPEESGITVVSLDGKEGTLLITAEEGKVPKVGDYICSDITEQAPYGFLIKVGSVKDASAKDIIMKQYLIVSADISLHEFCLLAGIREPGWHTLVETDASFVDDRGNTVEPEPKEGPKLFTYHVPLSFKDNIKLDYKQEFTLPSMEIYLDPTGVNVITGCRALIKNTETLHAEMKGKIVKEKGDFYKKYGVQDLTIRHTLKLPIAFPVYVTVQFKPSVPYELSLSGEVDLDILRNTKYNRLEFYYSTLTNQMTPLDPERGCFYQDYDFKERGPEMDPDDNIVSAKLEGIASIGLDFEFSLGLYGGNFIEPEDNDKDAIAKISKYLSVGANVGYKMELKSSLGLQGELDGQGQHRIKVIDDNKISSYVYGKLWTSVLKAEVAGLGLDIGKAEAEVKVLKQEFHFPNYFRNWRKLKVVSKSNQVSITAKNSFLLGDWLFKESRFGFCLESFDGEDYWIGNYSGPPLSDGESISFELPVPVDQLRKNITYTVYPFSMISNFPFIEGEKMVCRKGTSFVVTDSGDIRMSVIDDVPGEVL